MQIQHFGPHKHRRDRHLHPQGHPIHIKNLGDPLLHSNGPTACALPLDLILVSEDLPPALIEDQAEIQGAADLRELLGVD